MRLGPRAGTSPDPSIPHYFFFLAAFFFAMKITSFRFVSVPRRGCTPFERTSDLRCDVYFFFFAAFFFAIVLTSFRSL